MTHATRKNNKRDWCLLYNGTGDLKQGDPILVGRTLKKSEAIDHLNEVRKIYGNTGYVQVIDDKGERRLQNMLNGAVKSMVAMKQLTKVVLYLFSIPLFILSVGVLIGMN